MTIASKVARYIMNHPGSTAQNISAGVFGRKSGYPQRVNHICLDMCEHGDAHRQGAGTKKSPYRYYPGKMDA